jgi:hypothetical protein
MAKKDKIAVIRYCITCGGKMVRNGKTSLGRQRWKCSICNASKLIRREYEKKKKQFLFFQDWALHKDTMERTSDNNRMWFYRNTLWCFDLDFTIPITGEIYDVLQVDGTDVGRDSMCIILRTPKHAVGRIWCRTENYEVYSKLVSEFPAPDYIVCDGNKAGIKAVEHIWRTTKIQRRLWHVHHTVILKLSSKPRSEAAKELLRLAGQLVKIKTIEQRDDWSKRFDEFGERYKDELTEKTTHINKLTGRKSHRYKHTRLRTAYSHINTPYERGDLFRFLDNENVPSTNNFVEGGMNAPIQELRRCHRGLTLERLQQIIDLYLLKRSEFGIKPFIDDFIKKSTQNVT